ncbi:VirB8/TrbF family protein, partial [Xanthomonas campestris]
TAEPTSQTTDEQLRNNPMGIYVRDYSWSRLL